MTVSLKATFSLLSLLGQQSAGNTWMYIDYLPAGGQVLELGCEPGVPMTHFLANHFEATGVDISTKQLLLARQNVPEASFVQEVLPCPFYIG